MTRRPSGARPGADPPSSTPSPEPAADPQLAGRGAVALIEDLHRTAVHVRHRLEQQVLTESDLSWAAFGILSALAVAGPTETRQLAADAGITKGTLSGVINTLERRDLVQRARHGSDGRLVLVRLTARGRRLVEGLAPRFQREAAASTAGLSARERQQLSRLLHKLGAAAPAR